ncbi:MAG TPA: hypothetical protein VLG47_01905 [Candidatus Saccharimonadales bacterium]|nr:hypothetical protein [Candidatus Saccharimonadales bacterium]
MALSKNENWVKESGWYLMGLGSGVSIYSSHVVIGIVIFIAGLLMVTFKSASKSGVSKTTNGKSKK